MYIYKKNQKTFSDTLNVAKTIGICRDVLNKPFDHESSPLSYELDREFRNKTITIGETGFNALKHKSTRLEPNSWGK